MILDTNALSAMADGDPRIGSVLQDAASIALPAIVLGEYQYGIRRSQSRARYERWLRGVMESCRILPMDKQTAASYAAVRDELKRAGQPIPANDAWIAALARQHDLRVLSRDAHFDVVARLKRLAW